MNPRIDVVVIGLNSARTLAACLESVKAAEYPQELISMVYADGGSTDGSEAIAKQCGATFLLVTADTPSPGRQRNAGWQAGSGELVMFLDSDTVMDPQWLGKAVAAMVDGVGAVSGNLRELKPEASVYNWIGDREWNGPDGEANAFGGIVLLRRAALVASGGYNLDLIGGEDPELSYRVRQAGYRLVKINALMAWHDLNMHRFKQYWKRGFRTGHAYAEVNAMHPDYWAGETRRILQRGGLFCLGVLAAPFACLSPWSLVLTALGTLFLVRPRLMTVGRFARELGVTKKQARVYAWHVSFVVLPQFLGMLRYYGGRLTGRPLTNKRFLLKKGKAHAK